MHTHTKSFEKKMRKYFFNSI